MLRGWLLILGLIGMGLVVASCSSNPDVAAAMAGATAAKASANAATQVATAATQAAVTAAEQIKENAIAIGNAVASGQVLTLPTLPDNGQVIVVNTPTYTYVLSHGNQYVIPKPKPLASPYAAN
jgi:hypothetical protein